MFYARHPPLRTQGHQQRSASGGLKWHFWHGQLEEEILPVEKGADEES
jgi:hypothetical protein